MERVREWFSGGVLEHRSVVTNNPRKLYPQERDWTCSIACIRSLLSGFLEQVPEEESLVEACRLQPGPHYSGDIKRYHLLDNYNTVYGCDHRDITFDALLDYMEQGYFVMVESMINYAHWMVLLGCYPAEDGDPECSDLLLYDPYYNKVRLVLVDEFLAMWRDGDYENTRVDKDFIAVKK